MKINGIEIKWLGHSGFSIRASNAGGPGGKLIYIDPYNIKDGLEPADIILITHSHYDHCSYADMKKIVKDGTKIVASADAQSTITKFDVPIHIELIEPDRELDLGEIKVYALPAYNIDKHFHSRDESWMGYVIKVGDTAIYHSGDTDIIPEMQKLTGYKQPGKEFVALLPVGGRFTMSAEEAAEVAKIIKPTLAIPMHWGTVVGTEDDAKEFCELCKENGVNAKILEKE